MTNRYGWAASWLAGMVFLLSGCGGGEVEIDAGTDAEVPLVAVAVETVAPTELRAGQTVMISCLLQDADGETFAAPADMTPSLRFVSEESVEQQGDGSYIAVQAGEFEVACSFSSLRLIDDTPALVRVLPGAGAFTQARLNRDSIRAGESTTVSCEVFDAYGNAVSDAMPTLRTEPLQDGNTFEGMTGTFERAGVYDVYCDLPGAMSRGVRLEVTPGLPSSLAVSRVPDQPVYAIGQVVDIARVVTDRYGNVIDDVPVPVVSEPEGQELGDGRFRYLADGLYRLTATVTGPTEGDVVLSQTVDVLVDGNGPSISCDDPFDGQVIDQAPGSTVTFRGAVTDLSGVTQVRVNGTPVGVDSSGNFSIDIVTRFGINFIDLAAVDSTGQEASRTCAFLISDRWAVDGSNLNNTVSLRLLQSAFDDSNRDDGLDSLNDIFHTVLNSSGLVSTLDSALDAANPLKPYSCDWDTWFGCGHRSGVNYDGLDLRGPNTSSLSLADGGLAVRVRMENVRMRLDVRSTLFDNNGWVSVNHVEVNAIFDVALRSGRPTISVRSGSVSTDVGGISTDFGGFTGWVVNNIIVPLANGTLRDIVRDQIQGFVTGDLNAVLDGVFDGLDVSSLGSSFEVPRLDGSGNIPLSFGVNFSHLNTSGSRMLLGMGTNLSAPPAHARPTFGAPIVNATRLLDASGSSTTTVALFDGLLNQALHALWLGGFLDVDLSSLGDALPAGVSVRVATGLPPVAMLRDDGRVELSLGTVSLRLTYPALFAEPINIMLGIRGSMRVQLVGEDLSFDGFMLDELYFSTDDVSLDMSTRDTLEGFLSRLLGNILERTINDALPAIPVPSFTLPASLSMYGLPAGAELGLVSPSLTAEQPHFVLRGNFAVR